MVEKMADIIVIFDERSLALSKKDYDAISQYDWKQSNSGIVFLTEDDTFTQTTNGISIFSVKFKKLILAGDVCFEISQIAHKIDLSSTIEDDLDSIKYEVYVAIKQLFQVMNQALLTDNSQSNNFFINKYYVRDIKNKTFDLINYHNRINISNFVDELSYKFAIYNQ